MVSSSDDDGSSASSSPPPRARARRRRGDSDDEDDDGDSLDSFIVGDSESSDADSEVVEAVSAPARAVAAVAPTFARGAGGRYRPTAHRRGGGGSSSEGEAEETFDELQRPPRRRRSPPQRRDYFAAHYRDGSEEEEDDEEESEAGSSSDDDDEGSDASGGSSAAADTDGDTDGDTDNSSDSDGAEEDGNPFFSHAALDFQRGREEEEQAAAAGLGIAASMGWGRGLPATLPPAQLFDAWCRFLVAGLCLRDGGAAVLARLRGAPDTVLWQRAVGTVERQLGSIRDSLTASGAWLPVAAAGVGVLPFIEAEPLEEEYRGVDCEVCGRRDHPASYSLSLCGPLVDAATLARADGAAFWGGGIPTGHHMWYTLTFNAGRVCRGRLTAFSQLHHFKFHMLLGLSSLVARWLRTHRRGGGSGGSGEGEGWGTWPVEGDGAMRARQRREARRRDKYRRDRGKSLSRAAAMRYSPSAPRAAFLRRTAAQSDLLHDLVPAERRGLDDLADTRRLPLPPSWEADILPLFASPAWRAAVDAYDARYAALLRTAESRYMEEGGGGGGGGVGGSTDWYMRYATNSALPTLLRFAWPDDGGGDDDDDDGDDDDGDEDDDGGDSDDGEEDDDGDESSGGSASKAASKKVATRGPPRERAAAAASTPVVQRQLRAAAAAGVSPPAPPPPPSASSTPRKAGGRVLRRASDLRRVSRGTPPSSSDASSGDESVSMSQLRAARAAAAAAAGGGGGTPATARGGAGTTPVTLQSTSRLASGDAPGVSITRTETGVLTPSGEFLRQRVVSVVEFPAPVSAAVSAGVLANISGGARPTPIPPPRPTTTTTEKRPTRRRL